MDGREKEIRRDQEEKDRVRLAEEVEKRRYYEESYHMAIIDLDKQEILFNKQNEVLLDLLYDTKIKLIRRNMLSNYKYNKKIKKEIEERIGRGLDYWKPIFDPEFYLQNNEDVASIVGDNKDELLRHYLTFGLYEGRKGNDEFDVLTYMAYNPDLVEAFGVEIEKYFVHYAEYGYSEKRICTREN